MAIEITPPDSENKDIYGYNFDSNLYTKIEDGVSTSNPVVYNSNASQLGGSVGNWAVDAEGQKIINADGSYIKIQVSPDTRILIADESNDRVLIGKF